MRSSAQRVRLRDTQAQAITLPSPFKQVIAYDDRAVLAGLDGAALFQILHDAADHFTRRAHDLGHVLAVDAVLIWRTPSSNSDMCSRAPATRP